MISSAFLQHGYGVMPSFVEGHELDLLRSMIDDIASSPPDPIMARPGNHLFPLRWDDVIVSRLLRSSRRRQLLQDLLEPPDLKWVSAYVSTKEPQTPALWWHQDWWCWDHPVSFRRAPAQIAVLCYTAETTARNGALRVLPGSHRKSTPLHMSLPEAHGSGANAISGSHPAMRDVDGQETIDVAPGDAVVIDYRLLHGTHANMSRERRDCVLLSFMPAWRNLPPELRAHLILHPALPSESDHAARLESGYDDLLPGFDGAPVSLSINRTPPLAFVTVD